jgi:hypothetical protein
MKIKGQNESKEYTISFSSIKEKKREKKERDL